MQSDLGKVRGLGSAKSGTHHWWMQRVTAVALIPLVAWLLVSITGLAGADHATVTSWVAHPVTTTLLVLFLFAGFYHMKLGGQVVIEDYVHSEGKKIAALLALNFFAIVAGTAAILSVLRISFGS